jgi:hypothetical protein
MPHDVLALSEKDQALLSTQTQFLPHDGHDLTDLESVWHQEPTIKIT